MSVSCLGAQLVAQPHDENPTQTTDSEYLLLAEPRGVSAISLKTDSSAMEIQSKVE